MSISAGIHIVDEISHPLIAIDVEESHHSLQFCQKSFYIRTNYGVLCYTYETQNISRFKVIFDLGPYNPYEDLDKSDIKTRRQIYPSEHNRKHIRFCTWEILVKLEKLWNSSSGNKSQTTAIRELNWLGANIKFRMIKNRQSDFSEN